MLLTATLELPRGMPPADEIPQFSIGLTGSCLLTNVRPGIWIAGTCTHPVLFFLPFLALAELFGIPHCSLVFSNAADMNMLRCPVCNIEKCEGDASLEVVLGSAIMVHWCWLLNLGRIGTTCGTGTMQVLDARHCELYLEKKFRDGTWEYEDLGSYFSNGPLDTAGAAIFNRNHINTPHTGGSFLNHLST